MKITKTNNEIKWQAGSKSLCFVLLLVLLNYWSHCYDFLFNVSTHVKLVACTSTNTQRLLCFCVRALLSRLHAPWASMCLCGVHACVCVCVVYLFVLYTGRNLNKINDREIVKQNKMTIKWNKRISLNHSIVQFGKNGTIFLFASLSF